jgi:single-strand DNA-binding protein
MSRAVNKAILLGRLGADPEIRYTSSGTPVVNVSLATNESYTNREGERVEKTEWHKLVFWRQLAEIAGQYLRKGGQIYVEGTLRYRTYEDSEGRERFTTEVEVRELSMLDGPRGEELDTSFDPEELEAAAA